MSDNAHPIVKRDFGNIVRDARGYSLQELKDAGIDSRLARVSGIPFDRLRRSKHEENIEILKKIAQKLKESRSEKSKPPKPKAQKKRKQHSK